MKKGFTLAEVLITLTIIGVIASMTIPSLLGGTDDKQYHVKFKKAYSVVAQALREVSNENGNILADEAAWDAAWISLGDKLHTTQFKSSSSLIINPGLYYTTHTGGATSGSAANNGSMQLNDGTFMFNDVNTTLANTHNIKIDVNGYQKGPNQYAKDLYIIQVYSDGNIKPWGAKGTYYLTDCDDAADVGYGCAVKVLLNQPLFE